MHWLTRHRFLILAAICALWTGLVISLHYAPGVPFLSAIWSGEQSFEDLLRREGRKTNTHSELVLLGIDQTSLQLPPLTAEELASSRGLQLMSERPYPWSRETWALLLDRLFASGARLVMFDLIFNPPNNGDVAFHEALEKYRDRVVIGANIDTGNGNQIIGPNEKLIPPPPIRDDRVGYVNYWPQPIDRKVRAANFTTSDRQLAGLEPFAGEEVFESFATRALEKLGHGDNVPRDQRPHLIRFSAVDAYQPRSVYEIFDPKMWHANYADGAFFKNKVVLVGFTAQVQHDVVDTPMSPDTLGPALHLQTIAAALDQEFLVDAKLSTGFMSILAAGALSWVLTAFIRRPLWCLMTLVAISAVYLGVARILYDRSGLLVLVVPTLTAFLLSGLFGLGFEYTLERLEKLRTRRTLERYVSKNLVKEILDSPSTFFDTLRGSRREVVVLFSDIFGFTSMSEVANPEALVRQLNEYLSRMTKAVFENDGTLDKFIGDAVMAVWGNVRSRGLVNDAKSCVRAALAMRRELRALNEKWGAEKINPMKIGIGINHGEVLVGNIGSEERMDFTVIGDAVNLASRIEGLTRMYDVDILLGPSASELVADEYYVRSVARVQVKGRSEPVQIYHLLGARSEALDPEFLRWLESYEEGLRKFQARDFKEAKILFSRFLEFYPDDHLAKLYLERALAYESQPPDEAWVGVEVFTRK
ncbi:MAG: adenylate cyclase [Verrucomicrobiota bacterium]|jgi:adenylate cyclase